jgi:small basic protein (TIGR04137 family)
MSLHSSLKKSKAAAGHRNVLKREERLSKLTEEERWRAEGNSIYGLPKVRSIKVRLKKKPKKKVEGEGTADAAGATPAAGAVPAAAGAAAAAPAKK